MSDEQIKIEMEMEEVKQTAIKEFYQRLEDASKWRIEFPWFEDYALSILSKDDREKFRIYVDGGYLSVNLGTVNLITEETPERKYKIFSWFIKTPAPVKSELRQKIENLEIILRNEYKTESLKNSLDNMKDILKR